MAKNIWHDVGNFNPLIVFNDANSLTKACHVNMPISTRTEVKISIRSFWRPTSSQNLSKVTSNLVIEGQGDKFF